MAYNLHDLKVVGLDLWGILDCRVESRTGEHSSLTLYAYPGDREEVLYETQDCQPIEVWLDGDTGKELLFAGVVTSITLQIATEMKILRIEGKSYSWLLDRVRKNRSFQDVRMSHSKLMEQILQDYPDGDFTCTVGDQPIGKLFVQYGETDWEFLQRVMSAAGITVTPCSYQVGVWLYAGIPDMSVSEIPYRLLRVKKDMGGYYFLKANDREVEPADFTRYQIQSERLLRIFERVKIKGQPFVVCSCRYSFDSQEMMCQYELQMAGGLARETVYPMQLIGVALNGKITQVSKDKVQVALKVDAPYGNTAAYEFPYSTISASPDGSGWYCMPEIGDEVRVYFPSKHEEEAIALSSVSNYSAPKGGQRDRMQDPNSRYLRTKAGQELALAPDYMKLSCADGISSAAILNDGTVQIYAGKELSVTARNSLTVHAEDELTVHSRGNIVIQSMKGGRIKVNQQNIELQGAEVKFE